MLEGDVRLGTDSTIVVESAPVGATVELYVSFDGHGPSDCTSFEPRCLDLVAPELYATGARPRSTALRGVGSLTASERRVADLAADGLSNRDIAQMLFVTPKTIEVHLSNAYRKLEVGSRRELPRALAGTA